MKLNLGYFWAKLLKILNRPTLRNCSVDKTAAIGTGSNCICMSMGRYSYMGKNNSVVNASIGAFCSIASYCAIGGSGHVLTAVSTSPVFFKGSNALKRNFSRIEMEESKPVEIGNDVWIGEGVFISEGVKIGHGAVVGAHSVVKHDIAPYEIVAGAPARVIRKRFTDMEIEKLIRSEWWDWPDEKLKENGKLFVNAEAFLHAISGERE